MKNTTCPYCQQHLEDPKNWEKHIDSLDCRVEIEINNDPSIRAALREYSMDYHKMDHQIGVKSAMFRIALQRALDYKYPPTKTNHAQITIPNRA